MAGGSEWKLLRREDDGDLYQKVAGGPWFLRPRVIYTITRKVLGVNAPSGSGEYGDLSGMITYTEGGTTKSRILGSGGVLVCKSDVTEDIEDAQAYVKQIQVWVYESASEQQINFN